MPELIFVVAVVIYAAIAAQDLRQRRISNLLCVAILILGLARWVISMQLGAGAWAVGTGVALFALGLIFFKLGWLAGGDVKLISASAVLLGAGSTLDFLMLMSILGGVLALVLLVHAGLRRLFGAARQSDGAAADGRGESSVIQIPYGVAIAVAAPIILFLQHQRA